MWDWGRESDSVTENHAGSASQKRLIGFNLPLTKLENFYFIRYTRVPVLMQVFTSLCWDFVINPAVHFGLNEVNNMLLISSPVFADLLSKIYIVQA